ncbi:MAG: hypothetical protein HQL29_01850 [Candidatus Omnitrophica bacterium]|nr:hypothetical protein [Candidatus Omnitrophota bacterium]
MSWKTFGQIIFLILLVGFVILAVSDNVNQKYELYYSDDGTVIYRFNTAMGTFESDLYRNGKWEQSTPKSFIKKPS